MLPNTLCEISTILRLCWTGRTQVDLRPLRFKAAILGISLTHKHVPLSSSGITWYRLKGGDALRLFVFACFFLLNVSVIMYVIGNSNDERLP